MKKFIALLLTLLLLSSPSVEVHAIALSLGVTPQSSGSAPVTCPNSTNSTNDGCAGAQTNGTIINSHLADPQAVISLNIVGGSGYSNGSCSWTTTGGGGSGANGTITVSGGALGGGTRGLSANYTITSGGSGYTSRPTINLSGCGSGTGGSVTATVYQLTPHNASGFVSDGINWSVPGVDYPVGYDTTLSLSDPTSAGLPSGCSFGGSTVTCSTTGGTLNGYDFSLHGTSLTVSGASWTISNNKFACVSGKGSQISFTNGAAGQTENVQYNTFTVASPAIGSSCSGSANVAAITTTMQSGTLNIKYNLCQFYDSKCFNISSTGSTTLTVNEMFNHWMDMGICGGSCSHGEAEYSFGGTNQIIDWNLQYNIAYNTYDYGPTNLTSEFAQVGDEMNIVTATKHNYGLSMGTQSYTGSNNGTGQVASASMFCGHQNDPNPGSLSGTMKDDIWDYSGAFFPYNQSGNTCHSDITPADFNAGTGHVCGTSSCN